MNIASIIKNKTCYIVSSELKQELLKYLNNNKLLLDVHFFSLSNVLQKRREMTWIWKLWEQR